MTGDDRPDMIRAFIAAGISDEVRGRMGQLLGKLRRTESGVKWSRLNSIHLTLRFLGNIFASQVDVAAEAMAEAVMGMGPVTVEVAGWGTFPEGKRPRVIWLGIQKGAPGLQEIFEGLEKALIARGLGPADKKFSPHLTLGRVKTGERLNQALRVMESEARASFGQYEVDRIFLIQSRLNPAGAEYTVLREARLG
ncbi:MAG TPA: RNA 2',3'-cyclic phosphodiesterase [bacterium]|nr:RNA 2',3'-cyclic phosphodiesterase [bacterium]